MAVQPINKSKLSSAGVPNIRNLTFSEANKSSAPVIDIT